MHDACMADEAAFRKGEPAIHKLQMLPTVQQITAVKTLQHNLLEKDILGALRDWLEPKRDAAKTLPSLSVRSAVYEILARLPCQTDHLKRSAIGKKPIGHIILELRKHKDETAENKRALKELMEKWCRPVFRKVGQLSSARFSSVPFNLLAAELASEEPIFYNYHVTDTSTDTAYA
jgi:transcription factor SPN1